MNAATYQETQALLEADQTHEGCSTEVPQMVLDLIGRGAMFVVNHSGGKDSQAMFIFLKKHVPESQLVIVHADLGRVEWAGAKEHIAATVGTVPVHVCRSRRDLIQMITERGMFPSPTLRQCTSDLKRGPIEKTIRHLVEARMSAYPGVRTAILAGAAIVVNCMGMRAEESSSRAKLTTFKFSERNSKAGREWYDWLPIHDWLVGEVFGEIKAAGQEPHPVYAKGMSRFSCCFCVMASQHDLRTAAGLAPELYKEYVMLERTTGQVMLMPTKKAGRRTLEQVTGVYIDVPATPEQALALSSPPPQKADKAGGVILQPGLFDDAMLVDQRRSDRLARIDPLAQFDISCS